MPAGEHRPADVARVAVAVSGGLDSSCLLHAAARFGRRAGVEVHALHVHHGLQPQADHWLQAVAARCRRWGGIVFHARRIDGRPARGDSVEAWARRERYAALARMAREAGCQLVLLAHHRRDQAETVLLQALRGAGAAGLSAMPRSAEREGLVWLRPWLDQPRSRIEAYARRWRLQSALDPSNTDPRWARSRLRQQVWPVLTAAFGDAETALAAVARQAQDAREVLHEVASADASLVVDGIGLRRGPWLALGPARRANVLRHWLGSVLPDGVPESLLRRLQRELPDSRDGRWPVDGGWLALHRNHLLLQSGPGAGSTPERCTMDLGSPGLFPVPGAGGGIRVQPAAGHGIAAAALSRAEVRPRQGGERFQSHPVGVPRALKKQYQAAGVPRWLRAGPLVMVDDVPVLVPGLGMDARALAWPGHPRVELEWVGNSP